MSRKFKRDLIYEFIDELKVDEKQKAIEIVNNKFEEIKEKVKELKYYRLDDDFYQVYRYYLHLRGLLYFLKNESLPEDLHPKVFAKFKWIAERLVLKNQMNPRVLEYFSS